MGYPKSSQALLTLLGAVIGLSSSGQYSFQRADSLFLHQQYRAAGKIYQSLIKDTSQDALHLNRIGYTELLAKNIHQAEGHFERGLASHPSPVLKGSLYSRLSMVRALQNRPDAAVSLLDSAVANGYINIRELDTAAGYNGIRARSDFKKTREQLFNSLYPCIADPQARQFDFWVGEWDVFVTGTDQFAGNSAVQKISGGCALLENWKSAVSEGKSLNFIDDSNHKWKQVWVGSYPNGKQDFVNGEYRDSVMRFTFITVDPQGHSVKGRFSFFNQGPNQVRQFNETSLDEGKTWTPMYDFTYKRKKIKQK